MSVHPDFYCSQFSRVSGEQLFGTAPHVATWLLLEYTGRWESKAFEGSDLPEEVKARLAAALDAIPDSRIQVLRQQPRLVPEGLHLFVALTREIGPALYQFRLDTYEDLLALDLQAVAAEDPAYAAFRRAQPLFLVCTHGRRDRCCAQFGLPVWDEVFQHAGSSAWQSSHLGGHRFAANVVCFPHGVYHGRIEPGSARALLDAYTDGQIYLPGYRGRACYPEAAQAAEYYLRSATGITGLEAFHLEEVRALPGDVWEVRFRARPAGTGHRLRLAAELSSFTTYASCRDTEPEAVRQFRLIAHETAAG